MSKTASFGPPNSASLSRFAATYCAEVAMRRSQSEACEQPSRANEATMGAAEAETEQPDDEVPQGSECPDCGERRMDWLAIDEDGETVTCNTCGTRYRLPQ